MSATLPVSEVVVAVAPPPPSRMLVRASVWSRRPSESLLKLEAVPALPSRPRFALVRGSSTSSAVERPRRRLGAPVARAAGEAAAELLVAPAG